MTIIKLNLLILLLFSIGCSGQSHNAVKAKEKKTPKTRTTKKQKAFPVDEGMCICMEIYQPVCGKDGKTYANSCEADCVGMKYKKGACFKKY